MRSPKILIVQLFLLLSFNPWSQNLDKIGEKEMISVSGGLNFNTITYGSSGIAFPSREPFTWYASGNINISILDVSFPFTYTYSNQGGKYTQPFNRTAMHPSYKWAKGHFGLTSMSFSPYTLSGYLFLGGGVELTPGDWTISLMAGRLNKVVEFNPLDLNFDNMAYKRFGYGLNVGYQKKGIGGKVIIFKAKDDPGSLSFIPPNVITKPQDNLVVSVSGSAQIIKNLSLEGEYALSALTQNLNETNEELSIAQKNVLNNFINANSTTDHFQAYKAALKYSLKWVNFAFNYEHIDPGYKTLGGYYFNNDLENYTFAPSFTLFKKKLNLGFNTGFQKNNLSGEESATTKRWVGSVNTSIVPVPALVFNGTYSNFSTFTRNRPTTDPFYYAYADTLNFYQLTQSASGMVSYTFGKSEDKNTLQALYNFQESSNLSGSISGAGAFGVNLETDIETETVPTKVHASNLSYTKQFAAIKAGLTVATNVNYSILPGQTTTFIGPTLNFQKSLFDKKSSLSLGSTYNRQYINDDLIGNIFNHRIAFTYTPKFNNEKMGQVSFSANGNYLMRLPTVAGMGNAHEVNVFLNLGYSF